MSAAKPRTGQPEREIVRGALCASPAFSGLSAKAIRLLTRAAHLRQVRSGDVVLKLGERSQALYVVATGRVGLYRAAAGHAFDAEGRETTPLLVHLRDAPRGGVVGGVSLTTETPRATEVVALRDSLLVVIERTTFDRLAAKQPQDAVEILRHLARQVLVTANSPAKPRFERASANIAVLPGHLGMDVRAFGRALCVALGDGRGKTGSQALRVDAAQVDAALGDGASETRFEDSASSGLLDWLADAETEHDYVILCADEADHEQWLRRCARQADRVLVVVDGGAAATPSSTLTLLRELDIRVPIELVIAHVAGARDRAKPADWMALAGAQMHHHVVTGRRDDFARLARKLTGQSNGLVLGGGGARGFAHLGMLRALDALKLPIDAIGGASMGAYVGALMATGHSADSAMANIRESFVDNNFLNDYVIPRVSLLSGNKFLRRLDAVFGEQQIEDLPTQFYCVSTNLSRGELMVHEQGRLRDWLAASMAVPGIVPPMVWHGELLCDGAILNSLPYQVMMERGQGRVIGVDVSNREEFAVPHGDAKHPVPLRKRRKNDDIPSIARILHRAATVVSAEQLAARETGVDCYIRMPVSGIKLFDWDALQTIVDTAYDHAMRKLEGFLESEQAPAE